MDLKIADGMGGEEAIKLLLELDPEAKIILCSGSVTDVVMIGYREYGISAVIRKPFKMVDLVNALQIVNSDSSKQVNAQ
jgi:DNA-binding NarL/FixJ family response regulator